MMKQLIILLLILTTAFSYQLHAQIDATINIQGVLRTTNGIAVDNGIHSIIFKFYETMEGGSAKWVETQDINVNSGIYSAILGSVDSFHLASPDPITFDRQYFLEVEVSGKALTPRIPLTPAPYALSLLGSPNTFPSSGAVRADGAIFGENLDQAILDLSPAHSIVVKGGILARGEPGVDGAPGAEGVNNNGYAFENDKESGLFSTGSGEIGLYTNNTERLLVDNDTVRVKTDLNVIGAINAGADVNMTTNSSIKYNGLNDWRLVETDYLEDDTDSEGWKVYNPISLDEGAWRNATGEVNAGVTSFGDFAGNALLPTDNAQVFKKQFTQQEIPGSNIAGTYTYIKVIFNYYFLDSWDVNAEDVAWAAFCKSENGDNLRLGWYSNRAHVSDGFQLQTSTFQAQSDFHENANYSDQWVRAEMVGWLPSGPSNSSFYIFFGAAMTDEANEESFAIGNIEIWVK